MTDEQPARRGRWTPMQRLLREEMIRRDWTQADLARASGLTEGYITQLMQGIRAGRGAETVVKIAQALGVHADAVRARLTGADPPPLDYPGADGLERDPNLTAAQRQAILALYWVLVRGRPSAP